MGPWDDPGYLALASGDVPVLSAEPPLPAEELAAAGGLLGHLEDDPHASAATFLRTASRGRSLALVTRCLQEARRPSFPSHPDRTLLLTRAARSAADFLDGGRLGEERVARALLAVRREAANAHRLRGELEMAAALLRQSRKLLEVQGREADPREAGEQAAYEAALLGTGGHWEDAVDLLESSAGTLPEGDPLRHRLLLQAGFLAGWYDTRRALRLLHSVLRSPQPPSQGLLRIADLGRAWWLSGTFAVREAFEPLDRRRAEVLASGDPWSYALLLWIEARVLAGLDLLAEADAAYNRLWPRLFELDQRPELIQASGELLVVLVRRGRRHTAAQVLAAMDNLLASWQRPERLRDRWRDLLHDDHSDRDLEEAAQQLHVELRRRWWHQHDAVPASM